MRTTGETCFSERLHAARRGAGNSTLLIAIAVSLLLAASAILLSRSGSGAGGSGQPVLDEADIPDVTGPVGDPPDIRAGGGIGGATNATVQLKDRNDPSRVAWELEFDALEPTPGGDTVDVDRPRAWYFTGNDSAVYVRADAASFVMPDITSEPESGRFTGNVELLQIDRASDGTLPPPLPENAGVRLTTSWLDFDAIAGELVTTETVTVLSERIEADCSGVRLVLNEVDRRLEYFEVPGRLVATILPPAVEAETPSRPRPAETGTGSGQSPTGGGLAGGPSGAAQTSPAASSASDEPERQFYAALFDGRVRVTQPERRVTADRARAWVELRDNRLPTETLAAAPSTPRQAMPLEAAVAALTLAAARQPETLEADELGLDEPIRFECAGPVTIRPMNERPAVLGGGDSLAARFEAREGSRVVFEDDALAAEGDADWVEYAFASRLLTLGGRSEAPTRTTMAETGTLVAEQVSLGLGTGVGQAAGAGLLSDADGERSVSWRDQADVVFRTEDGWMTGSLEQAIASGGVRLRDAGTVVTAEDANARFARASNSAVIERVVMTGDVSAETSRGTLTARRADLRFIVEGDDSSPHLAIATGGVRGEQDGQRVTAEQIEADLAPADDDGDIQVTAARATGDVRYDRDDGTFAEGEAISVDAMSNRVIALGAPASVGTAESIVRGERIELDDEADSIDVPGPGRLTLLDETRTLTRLAASWSGSMRYTDSGGDLAVAGEAELVSTPDPLTQDTIRGERITAVIAPAAEKPEQTDESDRADRAVLGGERVLVSAILEQLESSEPPSVELLSRTDPGAEPDRVVLLTGERIEADNTAGRLVVPQSGRLLVSDRRLEEGSADRENAAARGSALFDWDGSMLLDRRAGNATMLERVRLIHTPQGEERREIELECERLVTLFDADENAELLGDTAADAEIGPVTAFGAVWARSGGQQMLADTINYEPSTGVANASAAESGWVTLFDPARSQAVTAEQLLWSVDTGRIEVIRPTPVEVPNQ